ncbi:MAG: (d)CMP kinase [Anaerovoracaceae bacterium]
MLKGNEAQEGNAKILRVAIDGPSGAGKSTVAKKVAEELGIDYIDTGAMYRAVGYKMKQNGIAVIDAEKILKMIEHTDIDFEDGKIYLDGIDVSDKIRTEEISKAASACARLQPVREKLVEIQRRIGHRKSVVMDGRDIGTNVFPDAQAKFYVDAAPEERAKRRFLELREKGEEVNFEDVLEDVRKRDENDMTRELDPLRKADDAVLIDTTDMTVDEVVREILSSVKNKKA